MKQFVLLLVALMTFTFIPKASFAIVGTQSTVAITATATTTTIKTKKMSTFSKVKTWAMLKVAKAASSTKDGTIAGLLAFLLGTLGIHRVYMGSSPIIILWYILTLGGLFGILPLIDMIRLFIGHTSHYDGNNSLFAAFS